MSSETTLLAPDWKLLVRSFGLLGQFVSSVPYGSGHINDTYAVTVDQAGTAVRYIFQRINDRIFTNVPALMENIDRVTRHVTARVVSENANDASRRSLRVIPACDGHPYYRSPGQGWWRCYLFIEKASTHDLIREPGQAREAARAFGEFQKMLVDLPGGRLHETIPFFHHTRQRFNRLKLAAEKDPVGRRASVSTALKFAFERETDVDVLTRLQEQGAIPERVTHNDTKLNNVMLDDVTGAGICVIDLDTVMPGLVLYDFGDMVRTATNSTAEDETDISKIEARLPIFEALVEGYLGSAMEFLNPVECAHLVFAGRLMTYEVGIRFLTDHLEGDVYFRIKRPGHNLDRALNQFALLRSLESQADAMEAIVQRHTVQ
jgi:hypothetical protein